MSNKNHLRQKVTSNGVKKMPNIKKIKCAIFGSKNEAIERLTEMINEAENVEKKAPLAERLIKEVEKLLSCKDFDKKRADCEICHYIADLRKKTANLIIKAKKLK